MMNIVSLIVSFYAAFLTVTDGSHFLGATITWRPLNESATGTPVGIVITQTTSWNYTSVKCNNTGITNAWPLSNLNSLKNVTLQCIDNCGAGSTGYPNNVNVIPLCTSFSATVGTTTGQRSDIVYLASGDDFTVAFQFGAWRSLATVIGANWSLAANIKIQPRSDNGLYNSAPVATVMSPIYVPSNKTIAIHVPVADADGDTLRCRWANNSNGIDECGGVCPPGSLPPNTLIFPNCTIIITGTAIGDWYAIAVVVEDFIDSTSTTPLSSVPVQFLIQMVSPSLCIVPPEIIGIPDEQSCTPIAVGQAFASQLMAINHCGANVTIIDIGTLPFAGVTQGNIITQNSTTYYKSFSWTPTAAQMGYQILCAMAYDSQYSQSSQYCFKFYVSQNASSDCPADIIGTTTVTTTTTTVTAKTTTTTATSTTTTVTTTVTTTTTGTATTTMTTTETTTLSNSPTTNTISTTTSMVINTSITSVPTSTALPSTVSISTTLMSTTFSTSNAMTTTTNKLKPAPIDWPLIGVISGLFLLAIIALVCCFCWHCICPFATSPRYKTDATPILYHIERCTDPACDWPCQTSLSDTLYTSINSHYVYPTSSDIFSHSYTKLVQLSPNTSSIAHNRLPLSRANDTSSSENAHVSIVRVKVENRIRTAGNRGIKPRMLEAHTQNPNVLLHSDNIRVSGVSCAGPSNKSTIHNKLSRNSIHPYTTDEDTGSVRVRHLRSMSSDVIGQATMNTPSPLNFDDAIYLDSCIEVKNNSPRTNMIGSQQFRCMKINPLSKIDPNGISWTALRSQSLNLNYNHIHVERIPQRTKKNYLRNLSTFFSPIGELQKQNVVRVKRV